MHPNDTNKIITELTGIYTNLNNRWSNDPCYTDVYQAFRQEKYHEAYEKLRVINIESIVLDIIANSIDRKILSRLSKLLDDNIQIYNTRQKEFANINFEEVYSLHEKRLFADKFALLAKDKDDIQNFIYPTEQEKQMLLKENQTEKNLLVNERSEYIRANLWMLKDFYSLIFEISKSFQVIIESYFPVEKENNPQEINSFTTSGSYFDMKLVSMIHAECNNIQFENLSEIDFYAILNLQPTKAKLFIKSGEKTRVCFLIHKLYEHLKTNDRKEWRTNILKFTGIDEKHYNSKYKEPESEIPSRKSESFAERINKIFKYIS
jgi:hypothetical protein